MFLTLTYEQDRFTVWGIFLYANAYTPRSVNTASQLRIYALLSRRKYFPALTSYTLAIIYALFKHLRAFPEFCSPPPRKLVTRVHRKDCTMIYSAQIININAYETLIIRLLNTAA